MERRSYQVEPLDMGDLAHRCLMILSTRLTKEGVNIRDENSPWMSVTKEECDKMVEEILTGEGEDYREGLLSSDREQAYRGERVKQLCLESAWIMVNHVRCGSIRAMGYEVPLADPAGWSPSGCPMKAVLYL